MGPIEAIDRSALMEAQHYNRHGFGCHGNNNKWNVILMEKTVNKAAA